VSMLALDSGRGCTVVVGLAASAMAVPIVAKGPSVHALVRELRLQSYVPL
jgi:hypothetical protein